MQRTIKSLKVLIVLVLLGMLTGMAVQTKALLPQIVSLKPTNTPVAPTALVYEPTATPKLIPRIRILFTGDINLGRCIAKRALNQHASTNDYSYPFQFVAEELRAADITVGSLDSSLSDQSPPMPCPGSMNLIAPTYMVDGLKSSGFDVISTATNHIKDCGVEGFKCDNKAMFDTMDTLRAAGIQSVGTGNTLREARLPIVMERSGIRFAFLGINQIDERVWAAENIPGAAPLSQAYIDQIKMDITSAKQIADVVIVMPHWGVEYAAEPEDFQRAWAREFINAGASLVIGNHPHIIQPMEVFSDNKLILYALGNFVFDQGQSFRREGIALEVNFVGAEIDSWQLRPVSINYYTFQAHWADGTEAEYILARARGGQ